jgi:hypothetical protein
MEQQMDESFVIAAPAIEQAAGFAPSPALKARAGKMIVCCNKTDCYKITLPP